MSKRGYISRYSLILKKLKANPYSTFDELRNYIQHQFDLMQMHDDNLNIGFSKRTLQRDIKDIGLTFGIDISYSKQNKGYYISQNEMENLNFERMIEAFEIFNSFNIAEDINQFIYVEKQKPQGTENLYGLMHAIKNKLQIKFTHHKFWEDNPTQRILEPYGLKEFKRRWYIIGKDCNDDKVKSFALDRITNFEVSKKKFSATTNYNVQEEYRYSFGIISPNGKKPDDIILSFKPFQGRYIKTLPLHHTQQIIFDNDEELQIRLKLCITHDFIMELLSFGDDMKVLKPEVLIEEVKSLHLKAAKLYK